MTIIKKIIGFVMDILETVVFIASLFIVIYHFILMPNQVKGASMEPAFHSGDYILTSKVTYKFRRPERGDVVVFKSPKNPDIDYIKRIIGLPGDTLLFKDGNVFVNNQVLTESYILNPTNLWEGSFIKEGIPIIVPEGYIFIMGDNRAHSSDSREFGPIPIESIIGVVFYRYYPPNKAGRINNPLSKSLH